MKILVANLGSTSLKYRLFDFAGERANLLARGGFERVTDYSKAIEDCLVQLKEQGAITEEQELAAVGFKTVLAQDITGCRLLDGEVLEAMESSNLIAPAHNPPYLAGIRLFAQRMPKTPLVGLFETAFYQWIPETAKRYAVPRTWYQAGVRRWGFHGASHKYVAERSAELLGRDDVANRARRLYVGGAATPVAPPDLRVISCHLGGSASVTGIKNGVAIGNSMGLSPQSGLPHNNRVGDLDVFALLHMMRSAGLTPAQASAQLCFESGLQGLSGGWNDVRDLREQARKGNDNARFAIDFLVSETRRWIGSYYLALNGIDALVFTAGIGEHRAEIRAAICAELDELGIELDPGANAALSGKEGRISRAHSRVPVWVIPANEELVVAREVKRFLETHPSPCTQSGFSGHKESTPSHGSIWQIKQLE